MKRLCLDENRAVQLILPFPRASSSQLCSSPSREKVTPAPAVSRFTAEQTEFQAAGAWRPLRSLPLAAPPRPLGDGAGGPWRCGEGPARPAAPAAPTPPSSRHPAARASRPRRQHNPPCRRRAGLACLATHPRPPPGLAPASAPPEGPPAAPHTTSPSHRHREGESWAVAPRRGPHSPGSEEEPAASNAAAGNRQGPTGAESEAVGAGWLRPSALKVGHGGMAAGRGGGGGKGRRADGQLAGRTFLSCPQPWPALASHRAAVFLGRRLWPGPKRGRCALRTGRAARFPAAEAGAGEVCAAGRGRDERSKKSSGAEAIVGFAHRTIE